MSDASPIVPLNEAEIIAIKERWFGGRSGTSGYYAPPMTENFSPVARVIRDAERDIERLLAEVRRLSGLPRRGIYTASKTRHADKWKALRAEGLPVIATWIDEAGLGESASLVDLWLRCVREATSAEFVLLYHEPGDELKGAFVEVGCALASGVPIRVVGGIDSWSWLHHPLVRRYPTIEDAIAAKATP